MSNSDKIFSGVTKKQCAEFGQVTILMAIVMALYVREDVWVKVALVLTLITILLPMIFYPFAVLWFALARVLSRISSTMMMTVVFLLVVTPVGLIRRMLGRDVLRLKEFKKGKQSVMHNRDHFYTDEDFLHLS